MRIENLAKLLDGDVVNSPSISQVEELKTNANNIKRADVYICVNVQEIPKAIENGAYAVIFDSDVEIIDNELAWIKVDDIKKALVRYLRYKVIQTLPKIYLLDDTTFEIIKKICRDERAVFLDENIIENFSKILKSENNSILICNNKEFFGKINPSSIKENFHANSYIKVIKYSLLRIDFIYDDIIYKEKTFPYIFIDNLNKALSFSKKINLKISLDGDIYPNGHFEPFFIDKGVSLKKFGETSRVVIVEKSIENIENEVNFLNKKAKYANSLLCLQRDLGKSYDIEIVVYNDLNNLVKILKENYNFFLVHCNNIKEFRKIFKNLNEKERSLF